MPEIVQTNRINITPEKFLNACSGVELREIDLLIQSPRFVEKMKGFTEGAIIADAENFSVNSINKTADGIVVEHTVLCDACGVPKDFHGNRCGWSNAYKPGDDSKYFNTYMEAHRI